MADIQNQIDSIKNWVNTKIYYHRKSTSLSIIKKELNYGEVWNCDLGFNIGQEKNKKRPVLILSNNKINRSGKVLVLCITDAKDKINNQGFPQESSWYLLYSNTNIQEKMYKKYRKIPNNQNQYYFLDKDSIVQCEEIKSVSKARFDLKKGKLGNLHNDDIKIIKKKLAKVFCIDTI